MSGGTVTIDGAELALTNLRKDLYPSFGFTKERVLDYYGRISRLMLPYLRERALTLKRYPDGAEGNYFFEKRCPRYRPAWVKTADVDYGGEKVKACEIADLKSLLWAANLASLELHVPAARTGSPERPDYMVFDLDPGEGTGLAECARASLLLKGLLDGLKLAGRVKTSGKKGLHLYVPLNSPDADHDKIRSFSRTLALALERTYPDLITSRMPIRERKGKVFVDWSQNHPSKTMVCVYSLRAAPAPSVSFPLEWKELEAVAKGRTELRPIGPAEALSRAEKRGDLFRDVLLKKQKLPYL